MVLYEYNTFSSWEFAVTQKQGSRRPPRYLDLDLIWPRLVSLRWNLNLEYSQHRHHHCPSIIVVIIIIIMVINALLPFLQLSVWKEFN